MQLNGLASSLQSLPEAEKDAAFKLLVSTLPLEVKLSTDSSKGLSEPLSKTYKIGTNLGVLTSSTCEKQTLGGGSGAHNDVQHRVPEFQRPCPVLLSQQKKVFSRLKKSSSLTKSQVSCKKVQVFITFV